MELRITIVTHARTRYNYALPLGRVQGPDGITHYYWDACKDVMELRITIGTHARTRWNYALTD